MKNWCLNRISTSRHWQPLSLLMPWLLVFLPLCSFSTTPTENTPLESWTTPFSIDSSRRGTDYIWERMPSKQQRICAFIPSSDTSYWFAINYGLVKKARALGVSLKVFHTSDDTAIIPAELQVLVDKCKAYQPHTIIVGGIIGKSLQQTLAQFSTSVSVIAIGKTILSDQVDASTSISFHDIGHLLAKFVNQLPSSNMVHHAVIFPGDRKMQFVNAFVDGFKPTINSNKYLIKDVVYTQNSYLDIKSALTNYLNNNLDIKVIIGSAKVAQAAVEVLEEMSLVNDVSIISYELSAQVYRYIKRGNILAAVANPPVIEGYLAVDMALKINNQRLDNKHISPKANLVTAENIHAFDISLVFAPYGYRETLEVN